MKTAAAHMHLQAWVFDLLHFGCGARTCIGIELNWAATRSVARYSHHRSSSVNCSWEGDAATPAVLPAASPCQRHR